MLDPEVMETVRRGLKRALSIEKRAPSDPWVEGIILTAAREIASAFGADKVESFDFANRVFAPPR